MSVQVYALGFARNDIQPREVFWVESSPQVSLREPFRLTWSPLKSIKLVCMRIAGMKVRMSEGGGFWMPDCILAHTKIELQCENLTDEVIEHFGISLAATGNVLR